MRKRKICALLLSVLAFSLCAFATGCEKDGEESVSQESSISTSDESALGQTKEVCVTFLLENGEVFSEKTLVKNQTVEAPTNPERGGYVFVEWQIDGKKFDFSKPVTENIALVARWGATVTFDCDGGTEISPIVVMEGDVLTPPAAPQKEKKETETLVIDYKFLYWKLDGVEFDFSTPITENITLTASYETYISKK